MQDSKGRRSIFHFCRPCGIMKKTGRIPARNQEKDNEKSHMDRAGQRWHG